MSTAVPPSGSASNQLRPVGQQPDRLEDVVGPPSVSERGGLDGRCQVGAPTGEGRASARPRPRRRAPRQAGSTRGDARRTGRDGVYHAGQPRHRVDDRDVTPVCRGGLEPGLRPRSSRNSRWGQRRPDPPSAGHSRRPPARASPRPSSRCRIRQHRLSLGIAGGARRRNRASGSRWLKEGRSGRAHGSPSDALGGTTARATTGRPAADAQRCTADRVHDPGTLVPHRHRRRPLPFPVAHVEVRVAHPRGEHPHADLAGPRVDELERLDAGGLARGLEHGRADPRAQGALTRRSCDDARRRAADVRDITRGATWRHRRPPRRTAKTLGGGRDGAPGSERSAVARPRRTPGSTSSARMRAR